jgi:hypothetical protein
MRPETPSQRGLGRVIALSVLPCLVLVIVVMFFLRPLRRYVREWLMQSVTSAHYQIMCPPKALSREAMMQFAAQREPLFASLNKKLSDVASSAEIRVILDPDFNASDATNATGQPYAVSGTTIRTSLHGSAPELDSAADAEALLHIAWGQPGSPLVARWTALALTGQWQGQELGMAAAEVEQRVGHRKVANLLSEPADALISPSDRALLGAAWISAVAELGGPAEVRKLYSTKTAHLDTAEVTKTLGTTPMELERKWQMWMYAYIAGMPPASHSMSMPMDMPMPGKR